MAIWLSADLHLKHANILRHCARPFESIEEHDAILIQNWNRCVKPKDQVFLLGDFSLCNNKEQVEGLFKQLNGKITLIHGNHDSNAVKKLPFAGVHAYLEHGIGELGKCVLFHYPIERWNRGHYGIPHFHGHSHGTCGSRNWRLDVGVDIRGNASKDNYRPYSVDELTERLKNERVEIPDSAHLTRQEREIKLEPKYTGGA